MTLDEQIDSFITDLNEGKTNEGILLQRALFLVGELSLDDTPVNEILTIKDLHERSALAIGRLGELVGVLKGGGVIATEEDLANLRALKLKLQLIDNPQGASNV